MKKERERECVCVELKKRKSVVTKARSFSGGTGNESVQA